MSEKKNLQALAELLAKIVGIEAKGDPDEIIDKAVSKMEKDKDSKNLIKQVEKRLSEQEQPQQEQSELDEQKCDHEDEQQCCEQHCDDCECDEQTKKKLDEELADFYTSTITPPIWNYIVMKYQGVPDVKSWAELDLTKAELCDEVDEELEWANNQCDDTDYDRENGITFADIDKFLSTLPVDDLINYYDPDEIEVAADPQDDMVNHPDWQEFGKYDDQQLADLDNELEQQILDCTEPKKLREAMTMQQRLRRAARMRAKAAQIAMKRHIAMTRYASPEKLQDRARKLAIRMLKSKFAGNRPYKELSYNDRERVEKIITKMPILVKNLQRKMLPVVRKMEQDRFNRARAGK